MSFETKQTFHSYGLVVKPTKENEQTLYVLANNTLTCTLLKESLTEINYEVSVTAYQTTDYECTKGRTSFKFKCEKYVSETKWRFSTHGLFLDIYFAKNRGVGKWVMVTLFNSLRKMVNFDDISEISFKLTDAQARDKEEMTLRNQFYRSIGCVPYVPNKQTYEPELGGWETLVSGRAVLPIENIPTQYNKDKIEQMSVENMIEHLLKRQVSLVTENEGFKSKNANLKGELEPLRKLKEKCEKARLTFVVLTVVLLLVVLTWFRLTS